jgi:membrane protein DedA with SNARE-associated domain
MKFGQFAVWNFFAGAVFVLAVGPAAYGTGRVASGHHDLVSVGMLVGGVAVGALCVVLGVRHHRRRRAAPGNHPGSRPPDTRPAQERS